jgi:5-methylcytosine-specific restriction endonuclease McrA
MLRLGIDYGGKYTGLAVVDIRNNNVLYAKTVKMRSDIPDKYIQRRALRSMRRSRNSKKRRLRDLKNCLQGINLSPLSKTEIYRLAHKRGYDYREFGPDECLEEKLEGRHREEVLNDIRRVLLSENATEAQMDKVVGVINRQYRPKRFKNRILTKCKICGKNTPLKKNVRHLLIENILMDLPISDDEKQFIRDHALLPDGKEQLKPFFRKVHVNEYLRQQIYDISEGKLTGRTVMCKDRILAHQEFTKVPKAVVRVLPSTKVKIDSVIRVIRDEILPRYHFQEVVMESNNFDVAAKTKGRSKLPKDEYQKGHVKQEKGLVTTLFEEYQGHCVYCGKQFDIQRMTADHIYPKKNGGLNIYANLALACKDCNGKKMGRTPLEWGVLPHPSVVALLQSDLKKKFLIDATHNDQLDFNKFMGQASIGWRYLSQQLREITGNVDLRIERQNGLVTSHFRKWWGFIKERANPVHHAVDAVILASTKEVNDEGMVDMTLKPNIKLEDFEKTDYLIEFRQKQDRRSSQLHDQNPVSLRNGAITQRKLVTEIPKGEEDRVISEEFRTKLARLFEKYEITPKKCLNDEQAGELGCRHLKCAVKGTGPSQLARLKNNYYKVVTPNDSVAVGKDGSGKVHVILRKNRYLRKHMNEDLMPDGFTVEEVFRRGERVADQNGEVFEIKTLGRYLVLADREGVEKSKPPKDLKKVG